MTATGRRTIAGVGMGLAVLLAPAQLVRAEPIPLDIIVGPSIQQTDNRPCIIGDPSCHNPETMTYTLITPRMSNGTLSSPVYTVEQLRSIVGTDTLYIGVDLNQAMGHNGGAYTIERFAIAIDGITTYATSGATTLLPLNPGNGYSDGTIALLDLTGLSGSQTVQFTTTFSGATGGREQYFLRTVMSQNGHTSPAPEPATMILLGSGLAGLAAYRRRRRTQSAR